MVKCPFCQTEMDKRAVDIEMVVTGNNIIVIQYTNQYKCPQHGIITHPDQSFRVELP